MPVDRRGERADPARGQAGDEKGEIVAQQEGDSIARSHAAGLHRGGPAFDFAFEGGGLRHPAAWEKSGCHLRTRSAEHTSELQSLMRISYAVFCLTTNKNPFNTPLHQPS